MRTPKPKWRKFYVVLGQYQALTYRDYLRKKRQEWRRDKSHWHHPKRNPYKHGWPGVTYGRRKG